MKGIDVSENNGCVDFDAVKAAGYDFVIVRCSYGQTGRDDAFASNVARAHDAGLLVGAYHYDYSTTVDEAVRNAQNCRAAINESGVFLELPVFYDMEDADGWKARHGFYPERLTDMCRAFIENVGLDCGVYASESWLKNYIDWQSLGCAVWNASWYGNDNPEPCIGDGQDGIMGYAWQYTSTAVIDGSEFDADVIYD